MESDRGIITQSRAEAIRLAQGLGPILGHTIVGHIANAEPGSFWVNPRPQPEVALPFMTAAEADQIVDQEIERISSTAIGLGFGWGGFPGAENHTALLRQSLRRHLNRRYRITDENL